MRPRALVVRCRRHLSLLQPIASSIPSPPRSRSPYRVAAIDAQVDGAREKGRRSPAPSEGSMYHICRAPMPNPIVSDESQPIAGRLPAPNRRAQAWASLRLPSVAAVAGLNQRATPARRRSPTDLDEAGRRRAPALLAIDRACKASRSSSRSTSVGAVRGAASTLSFRRARKHAAFSPPARRVSARAVTQTPRPGSCALMSGDDRAVRAEHKTDHRLGQRLARDAQSTMQVLAPTYPRVRRAGLARELDPLNPRPSHTRCSRPFPALGDARPPAPLGRSSIQPARTRASHDHRFRLFARHVDAVEEARA